MGAEPENKLTAGPSAGDSAQHAAAAQGNGTAALLVRGGGLEEQPAESGRDTRLDRLPMQLDVMVRVPRFRVKDLLAMEQSTVIETVHDHSQDVPVRCGGALLAWGEFEVVEQKLAVRITRLA